MRQKVACVTGATGFLASELVAQLLGRGVRVHASARSLADGAKLACLRDLPGAKENLELFEADLLAEGAFDPCVAGADYVFHTASPFITSDITDAHAQLYAPSLDGTRNVFGSIARAVAGGGAKPRVVLTSSVAAVFGRPADKPADQPFDEDDWNVSSVAEGNPVGDGLDLYRYSKLIAEREAWACAEAAGLQMASVCPAFIVGPPRTPRTDGESLRNMKQALEGEMPHRGDTNMVDVRDVAAVHVAAALAPEAAGKRFITASERAVPRAQVLAWLRARYPDIELADGGPVADASGLRRLFRSKTLPSLGIELRGAEASIVDMAEAMLRHGVVKTRPRG